MADHQQGDQPSSSKGIERKIERALSRADQIDTAINYIKNLETKVKMAQEKKQSLMERKKRSRCDSSQAPKIEIHEMGSSLQIILTCGFDYHFIFSEIIRILHGDNIEVKSFHSSLAGNSMLHIVHAQIQESFQLETIATTIERLKRFVNGHREDFKDFPHFF
ncbi:Transcription factor bHLH162, partial [Mucuna pruriens]